MEPQRGVHPTPKKKEKELAIGWQFSGETGYPELDSLKKGQERMNLCYTG